MTDQQQVTPVARRAAVALAIRVASAGIAYLTQVLLARWLGLEQYGIFAAVWVWLLIAGGSMPLGLNVTVIGRLPHYLEAGDQARWRGLAVASTVLTLALSLLLAAGGIALLSVFPNLAGEALGPLAILALVCLPLVALAEINEGIARAHGWIASALLPAYVARPLVMLALGGMLLASGETLDAAAVLRCAIIACLVTSLMQTLWLAFRMHRMHGGHTLAFSLTAWLGLSLPMLVTETSDLLLMSLDLLFVAALVGAAEAGIYFAAQRTIALVSFVNFAVGAASANAVAAAWASGDRDALSRQIRFAATLAFWPSLAGTLGLVAASPLLLSLFGADFGAGTTIVAILAAGFLARSLVGPAELLLNVTGAQRACAVILASHLGLSLALNALLVPTFGVTGAATAQALVMTSLTVSFLVYARLRLGLLMLPGSPHAAIAALVRRIASLVRRPAPGDSSSPESRPSAAIVPRL